MTASRIWRITARDGLRLAVRDDGDPLAPGVPLLCLSGLTRNAADFEALAQRHGPARRVVALDYRGHGRSGRARRARSYGPEVMLDDVLQVMAALDLRPPVVVGTSLGGVLAMALAAAAPTRMRAVVLNDVGPEIPADTMDRILDVVGRDPAVATWEEAARAVPAIYPNLGVADARTLRVIAATTFVPGDDERLHINWDPRIVQAFREAATRDAWPLFRALRGFPTLVLHGRQSDVLTPDILARMREEAPDHTMVDVAGRGHAPMLDEPEAEAAIDDFVRDVDRRAGHPALL